MMTPRAHSSMAEQPAHNRLGLGSSPGGPTIVAGASRPAWTEGGLIEARVAPLRGQPDCCSELVAPICGQPDCSGRVALVRGQPVRSVNVAAMRGLTMARRRIKSEVAWILSS